MKHGTIITIGRQSGSGGHEIGKKLAEKLEDDYDKATASQEVKELKNATKLYYELYRKRYEKATILINQKNVDGYIETYHIKKSVT